jgi:hypothetical protein
MPSQICHLLFAEDSLREALGREAEAILREQGNIFRFGAQGPDFFYHNQRTRPTGLKFGVNAHREGYGRLVTHMIHEFRHLESKGHTQLPTIRAYILGFTTHAFLDKKTHPFIDYHSGWVEMDLEESERYYRCHIFLERIIDVLMLKMKRGLNIREFSLLLWDHQDSGEKPERNLPEHPLQIEGSATGGKRLHRLHGFLYLHRSAEPPIQAPGL